VYKSATIICSSMWLALLLGQARGTDPATSEQTKSIPAPLNDLCGDPLPAGARARLGNVRYPFFRPVALDPMGKTYACVRNRVISVVDTASGKVLRQLPAPKIFPSVLDPGAYGLPDDLRALAFSGDGTRLVAAEDEGLRFWDLRSGREDFRIRFSFGVLDSIDLLYAADGKRVAIGNSDSLRLFDVSTGRKIWQRDYSDERWVRPLAFHNGGKNLLFSEDVDKICLVEAATGKVLSLFKIPNQATHVSCADGKFLAAVDDDGFAYLCDVAAGKRVYKLGKAEQGNDRFAFYSRRQVPRLGLRRWRFQTYGCDDGQGASLDRSQSSRGQ